MSHKKCESNYVKRMTQRVDSDLILHPLFHQDVQTPRSNRSVDSGLPQDDITPRSDSLSTASSSASPPDGGSHNGHGVGQTHLGVAHHLHQQQQQHLQHQGRNETEAGVFETLILSSPHSKLEIEY